MRKKILFIFFALFFFFINMNFVSADDCSNQQEKIESYNIYKKLLTTIDCTDDSNSQNVSACNETNIKKNIVVTELMKLNEEGKICKNLQKDVDKIIEENEDNCGKIFDDSFTSFVNSIMVIFYILGPILLILFGSLDFAKATVSAEQDALRKAGKNFAKRVAATLLLFAAPTIVNFVISLNISDKYLSGNAYTCNYKYMVFNKKYKITYVPTKNTATNSNYIGTGGGSILEAAEKVHSKYEKERWTYGANYWNNIEKSTNDPNRQSVCATFIASVLYVSGLIPENEINKYNYNMAHSGIGELLEANGWIKITDYDKLQAGDVVFMPGHVQLFAGRDSAGNYLWYNAGSTERIQQDSPYVGNVRGLFLFARRKP
ncbi:MAG: hypothetical protein J6B64_00005 [Bacilli bacterium]|nr:hypothetical protein [Bacilli bacterium]MBP3635752.1 hypothetical protein [Bacilli bacterium]